MCERYDVCMHVEKERERREGRGGGRKRREGTGGQGEEEERRRKCITPGLQYLGRWPFCLGKQKLVHFQERHS